MQVFMNPKRATALAMGGKNFQFGYVDPYRGHYLGSIEKGGFADVVLDLLSWEYHEVIMAGAGAKANAALDRVVKEEKGKYLVIVEGAIPTADDGVYCTIGGESAVHIAEKVLRNAAATIAVGACAFDGGLVRGGPRRRNCARIEPDDAGLRRRAQQ